MRSRVQLSTAALAAVASVAALAAVLGVAASTATTASAASARPGQAAVVRSGQRLKAGQSRTSANHRYRLVMQRDGNLVLRRGRRGPALWSSQTGGHRGAVAVMQRDGNFVVYSRSHEALFDSGATVRHSRLVVQGDGNAVEVSPGGKVLWSSRADRFTLAAGQIMRAPAVRRSPNGHFELNMQADGNLVLYALPSKQPLWSSQTGGQPGAFADMQPDGNLVVYSSAKVPLYAAATAGQAGNRLVVQDDGNAVVYKPSGTAAWSSDQDVFELRAGQTLNPSQSRSSPGGRFQLVMQTDGNLVLYDLATRTPVFSSQTGGNPGAVATLQSDGNLVVYSVTHQALFATGTHGDAATHAFVQDDGSAVIYAADGTALWSSRTGLT